MAGRGADIKLGESVPDRGGPTSSAPSATNRAESTSSARALRREGIRQFALYVSFEDDLMRNFGAADRMTKIMERFSLEEGQN